MKKFLLSLGLVSIFLVTGCGGSSDKLVCTQTMEESGMTSEQKVTISFQDDKVDEIGLDMKVELPEEYLSYKSMYIGIFESAFSELEEEGIKPEIKETDNGFKLNIKMNRDQFAESQGEIGETKEDVKKSLEEDGYTCK